MAHQLICCLRSADFFLLCRCICLIHCLRKSQFPSPACVISWNNQDQIRTPVHNDERWRFNLRLLLLLHQPPPPFNLSKRQKRAHVKGTLIPCPLLKDLNRRRFNLSINYVVKVLCSISHHLLHHQPPHHRLIPVTVKKSIWWLANWLSPVKEAVKRSAEPSSNGEWLWTCCLVWIIIFYAPKYPVFGIQSIPSSQVRERATWSAFFFFISVTLLYTFSTSTRQIVVVQRGFNKRCDSWRTPDL